MSEERDPIKEIQKFTDSFKKKKTIPDHLVVSQDFYNYFLGFKTLNIQKRLDKK